MAGNSGRVKDCASSIGGSGVFSNTWITSS
jgi:hypothetical protein